ncbi:substrate-binding domain-containing protein [Derxia gummosa]|uniref:Substrate-binding domain-containing protein n=1 Tax=Derxia gummosa DSM 723 TaxID=1121388 RepID=A0A8B6X3A2_9BURK|nr:substrate-binding domain-containing protein [Derxia gummosa]
MSTVVIRGISSMATRQVLAELAGIYEAKAGVKVDILSIGGVDAAKRVAAGESFDVVFLATDAIDKLVAGGSVVAGSKVDLVNSTTAVAVRKGAPAPDLSSGDSLRAAVLAAPTLSYSTGPSGVALAKQFEAWGIADEIKARIVTAPPGVPVGSLVARGEVALGFQQLSELIHVEGIDIVGNLPADIAINTVFSAGICAASTQAEAVRGLLAFMASPEAAEAKRRQGMEPV